MTLRVGLLGYGKMGHAIEALAPQHGLEIVWKVDADQRSSLSLELLRSADVVIEFTRPDAAFENICLCLAAGVPVVSGTTGWNERLPAAVQLCESQNGALLWSSNFSVGVNLFFALNRYLAQLMQAWPEYQPSLTEIHHTQKLDAPSGTAVTLAEHLINAAPRLQHWELSDLENHAATPPEVLPIAAIREGTVPGTHVVRWNSPVDTLTIEHRAHSRDGFANGALLAARWLVGKKGVFSMADVLGLNG
jgi:4-hydroxy-tetrahydrodipicolinate reductase